MLFRRLLTFAALVTFLWSHAVLAQGVPTLADLRKQIDTAMERVGKGDIEGGLKLVRPRTIIPAAEFDVMLGQIPPQLPAIKSRFGAPIGFEFLKEETLGASLARITYLQKFEKHAMRWVFYCYRGKSGWVLNTFKFDDRWHELFPGQ
jgi:hypothetical protein